MSKENEEFYKMWIAPKFKNMEKKQDEIIDLLKGKNSDPGLIHEVRDNTRFRKFTGKAIWAAITAIIFQSIWWIRSKFGG